MIPMNVTVEDRTRLGLSSLQQAAAREDVRVRFGQPGEPRETVVIFTDDKDAVAGLTESAGAFDSVLYIGAAEDVLPWAEKLADIWPAEEPEAVRAARFSRLLQRLRDRFDSALYQGLLEATIATAPDLVWYKHLDGTHMLVNQVFAETVHKTREDIHGRDHYYIWNVPRPAAGEAANDCSASEEQVIREQKTGVFEEPVSTREGMKQLTTYKTPIYDPYGNIFGTVGFGHDVTHFSNMGIQLSILLESIPFPMVLLNWEGKVTRMSSSFKALAGVEDDQIEDFDSRSGKRRVLTAVAARQVDEERHTASQEYTVEINGEEQTWQIIEVAIRDYFDNISGYFCVVHDITFQRAYEREILEAANTDSLTGLYSRRYFTEYLSYVEKVPLTLLYMDMDRLKEANDRFGHKVGDETIQKTADVFRQCFPEGVIARLGGDEFAVVLEGDPDPEAIQRRVEEMEQAVRKAASLEGLPITVSTGIVFSDGKDLDKEAFLKEADRRMYEIKKRHHRERDA